MATTRMPRQCVSTLTGLIIKKIRVNQRNHQLRVCIMISQLTNVVEQWPKMHIAETDKKQGGRLWTAGCEGGGVHLSGSPRHTGPVFSSIEFLLVFFVGIELALSYYLRPCGGVTVIRGCRPGARLVIWSCLVELLQPAMRNSSKVIQR